jgi:hypothetical protein
LPLEQVQSLPEQLFFHGLLDFGQTVDNLGPM